MQHTGRTVLPADPPMYTQEGPVVAGANANEEYWRNAEMIAGRPRSSGSQCKRGVLEEGPVVAGANANEKYVSLSDIQTRFVTGKASWAHDCWVHFSRKLMGWQRPTRRGRGTMKGHEARCKQLTMTPAMSSMLSPLKSTSGEQEVAGHLKHEAYCIACQGDFSDARPTVCFRCGASIHTYCFLWHFSRCVGPPTDVQGEAPQQ